jgi:hypothetical protein
MSQMHTPVVFWHTPCPLHDPMQPRPDASCMALLSRTTLPLTAPNCCTGDQRPSSTAKHWRAHLWSAKSTRCQV